MNSTQVKERTAADLLNIVLPAVGDNIKDIKLPTSEVAVEFQWQNRLWKVDKSLRCVNGTLGGSTWSGGLETTLMERLLAMSEKSSR